MMLEKEAAIVSRTQRQPRTSRIPNKPTQSRVDGIADGHATSIDYEMPSNLICTRSRCSSVLLERPSPSLVGWILASVWGMYFYFYSVKGREVELGSKWDVTFKAPKKRIAGRHIALHS